MEGAICERCKAFAAAHSRDEDCQVYISASRRASSVISKAKAEAWQTTCTSLSLKSNPKTVYYLLRSIAGFPSSSPNFPNYFSPRESVSVYAAYLRSYFFVSWSAGLSTGVIRANVRPPFFQSIPTELPYSPTSSYSTPASISIQLQPFLGSPSTALIPFLNMYLR